jgi:type IV secretory pathway VirB2 component (pilin)
MANLYLRNWRKNPCILGGVMVVLSGYAPMVFASRVGGLPFNSTMNIIKDAISGPFLLAAAVIMIVITCLMLAFGEWGDGFKKLINMVLWLSVAFTATNFVTSLFGGGAIC